VLTVDIGFDPSYGTGTPTAPDLALKGQQALVDTGATECCIDSGIAMSLQLPIIDQRVVSGVSGHHTVNMHLAQIYVPSLSFTMYGAFAGVDLAAGGQPHAALIGRTFLQRFKMIYDGTTGMVTIEGPL
jgi:predicted aspartyl protease